MRILVAIRFARERWRSYFWVALLEQLGGLVVPEIFGFALTFGIHFCVSKLGLLAPGRTSPTAPLSLLPIAFSISLLLWLGAGLSFSIPAAALERLAGLRALRRSWFLTRARRWQIVLTCSIFLALAWILTSALEIVIGQLLWHFYHVHFGVTGEQIYSVAGFVIQILIAIVFAPILPISITLFYYDQRLRREGLDTVFASTLS